MKGSPVYRQWRTRAGVEVKLLTLLTLNTSTLGGRRCDEERDVKGGEGSKLYRPRERGDMPTTLNTLNAAPRGGLSRNVGMNSPVRQCADTPGALNDRHEGRTQ